MDWDGLADAKPSPSFTGEEDEPLCPAGHGRVASFDPDGSNSLKAQMGTISGEIACTLAFSPVVKASLSMRRPPWRPRSSSGPYVDPGLFEAAHVREHSWICVDAVVGHATEVKHSILLPGAKAPPSTTR